MINQKPIIGISCNVITDENGRFKDFWRAYVNEDYVLSVLKAGGIPVLLPIVDDKEVIKAQVENVDAIIITGGDADVNPELYGEKILKETSTPNPRRDWFDIELLKIIEELKKPTLCICRGHQIQNVFHGGTLYQDIGYVSDEPLDHDNLIAPDFLAHEIKINKESLLYDIIEKEDVSINSFHHQSVKEVGLSLKATAVSRDGVIEAIEYKNPEYFFLSIQWHPEMMASRGSEDMLKIFQRLIKEAKNK